MKLLRHGKMKETENYLRMVEYTSQRIPPVQYIKISVFSLSTFAKGSEAKAWKKEHADCINRIITILPETESDIFLTWSKDAQYNIVFQ